MADDTRIPAVSREYLYLPGIQAFDPLSPDAAADPTTLDVDVAFVAGDADPADDAWHTGEWASPTVARILIGPGGGVVLAPGIYHVWLRITGAVERPGRKVGTVTIT